MHSTPLSHLFPLLPLLLCSNAFAAEPTAKDLDFFEKRIRPVLVESCYECHSQNAKIVRGGLVLDTRIGIRQGGDSGPAVVPNQVDESLLISALKFEDFEMPPKGKLPDKVIDDFVKWIESGAPDPRDAPTISNVAGINLEEGRKHWAYQPIKSPYVPAVKDQAWPRNAIDRFVLRKLRQNGLRPAADADTIVLVRRVYYDLIGLPPTPAEVDNYVELSRHDPESAFQNLVDRLLASPRFGERWGRHWLDVVRFGESNTLRGTVFSPAWRYRDYVIDSMNDDLPFDEFVKQQVAGDLLPSDDWQQRRRQLIATTMLALGNTNFENQDKGQLRMDVVDEQLEVIGRAFLGQTIACARCHDHKFDPIPTRDYYALAGILRNTKTLEHSNVSRWLEVQLPSDPLTEEKAQEHASAMKELQQKIAVVKKTLGNSAPMVAGAKAVPIDSLQGIVVDDTNAIKEGAWTSSTSNPRFVGSNYIHDAGANKGEKSVTFETKLTASGEYEVRLAYAHGSNRAPKTPITIWHAGGETTSWVDQRKQPPIDGLFVSLGKYKFNADEPARVVVSNRDTSAVVIADAVQFLSQQELANSANKTPATVSPDDEVKQARVAEATAELKTLEGELKQLQAVAPPRELTMSVVEEAEKGDTRIHVRGTVHNLGAEVPRGFLQVVSYESPNSFEFDDQESGRRQLGEWLVNESNPLTARVTVNRLWHWLFGAGLVRTTDNFGSVGERPSHPELLDYLASHFQRDGWSIKSMLRKMVLSHTYRMSSRPAQPTFASASMAKPNIDMENRLLWRMNRRRLEAEAIRDTMLMVSGELDLQMHGQTYPAGQKADYDFQYAGLRRGVYAPVFRNSLPELFEVFDFADPSVVVGRRSVSTVAPQALYMMNNPMVIEQSRLAAKRLLIELPKANDAERIERAYRLALGRRATNAELTLAMQFIRVEGVDESVKVWEEFFQALFASLDFRYVD